MLPVEWPTCGDCGVSSTAIWTHMMGGDPTTGRWGKFGTHPSDPDDFGRCYRLLARFPDWRERIGEMARYGRQWAALVAIWPQLTAEWEAKIGTGCEIDYRKYGTRMEDMYKWMRGAITGKEPITDIRVEAL
jgi:hypothetical protein